MRWQFKPKDRSGRMAHLQTECAELLRAIGNATRFGISSSNPLEINGLVVADEILMEIWDVQETCGAAMADLKEYLGPERVQRLRMMWEAKAYPTVAAAGPADADSAPCGTCYGSGKITEQGCDGVRHCMVCSGTGFIKVPT